MPLSFLLTWQKKYETGIKLIDEQHRELISLINVYYVKCPDVPAVAFTLETLKELQNCFRVHFTIEESFQIQSKYPLFLPHQADHSNATFQARRFIQLLETDSSSREILLECKKFILTWLPDHLQKYDLPFFDYYNDLISKA